MTETEKIIWFAVVSLGVAVLAALILGVPAYLRRRKDEAVSVTASLTQASDPRIINTIGCAGLLLTVVGKSKRPARITGAELCVKGFDALPAFQQAFRTDFGLVPITDGGDRVFIIGLVPVSKPNADDGWILKRDDICRFVLPIQCPALPVFEKAPSQDVTLKAIFFDGSEHVILQGLKIQSEIRSLIEVWGQARQTLNVPLDIRIKVTSKTPPDISAVGAANPEALVLMDAPESSPTSE